MSCLVIKNDGIGDLVLSSGLIASISDAVGGELDLVTRESCREVAAQLHGIRRCYFVSDDEMRFRSTAARFGITLPVAPASDRAVLTQLRSTQYTLALSLRRFIRQSSFVLMNAVRAGRRACAWDYPTNLDRRFARRLSSGWEHYCGDPTLLPEARHLGRFAERILGKTLDSAPRLDWPDISRPGRVASRIGLCFSGGSSRWPDAYWMETVSELLADGWEVLLFGGPDVYRLSRRIEGRYRGCRNLVGSLSLDESRSELATLTAFVGNDTGFSHYASLIVPRCIVIQGGGTFGRFFPWPGTRNQYVLHHALDCYDCDWFCKFEDRRCLTLIRPRDLLDHLYDVLDGQRSPGTHNLAPFPIRYTLGWRYASIEPRFADLEPPSEQG